MECILISILIVVIGFVLTKLTDIIHSYFFDVGYYNDKNYYHVKDKKLINYFYKFIKLNKHVFRIGKYGYTYMTSNIENDDILEYISITKSPIHFCVTIEYIRDDSRMFIIIPIFTKFYKYLNRLRNDLIFKDKKEQQEKRKRKSIKEKELANKLIKRMKNKITKKEGI